MKNILVYLSLFLLCITANYSCGSIDKSEQIGEKFYKARKISDFETVLSILDEEATKSTAIDDWVNHLKSINLTMGELKSYKRIGFYTEVKNGLTTTELSYSVLFDKGVIYEKVVFVKRGNQYKILSFKANQDKDKL